MTDEQKDAIVSAMRKNTEAVQTTQLQNADIIRALQLNTEAVNAAQRTLEQNTQRLEEISLAMEALVGTTNLEHMKHSRQEHKTASGGIVQ